MSLWCRHEGTSNEGQHPLDVDQLFIICTSVCISQYVQEKINHCRICKFPCKYRCGTCAPQVCVVRDTHVVCVTQNCGTCVYTHTRRSQVAVISSQKTRY